MPERYLGKNIGPYRVMELVGTGGIGFVYKVMDEADDTIRALKILRHEFESNENVVKRFEREALSMARLDHPNIIKVYHFDRADGIPYFVMEYLNARELSELIEERGRFTYSKGMEILKQVAGALGYIHDKGVIHRDIKSRNVMITTENVAKLLDFGLARISGDWTMLTAAGDIFGTPAYMSPEQIKGKSVDHRTDIYAFGILCYEVLTGDVPFLSDTPTLLFQKHLSEPPVPPREINNAVPALISDWILKMLQKNPDTRFQSMHELEAALDFIEAGGKGSSAGISGHREEKSLPVNNTVVMERPATAVGESVDPLLGMSTDRDFKIAYGHYKQGLTSESRRYLKKIIQSDPRHLKARSLLGQISLEEKNYPGAMEHFVIASNQSPFDAKILTNLGIVFKHLGKMDESRNAFRKATDLDPKFKAPRKNLASVYVSDKNYSAALEEYREILKIDPNDFDVRERLSKLAKMVS